MDPLDLCRGAPGREILVKATDVMRKASESRLASEAASDGSIMQYGPDDGDAECLSALSSYLSGEYGENVNHENLLITAGATSGLYHLLTLLFPNAKPPVFAEEVTYHLAISMIRDHLRFPMVSVPMEDDGIDILALDEILHEWSSSFITEKHHGFRAILYLVPTFQNPTGVCMSDDKRMRVVQLSRKYSVFIICDDVYDLLYYEGVKPPRRLFAFDCPDNPHYTGSVVSNATFSKYLGPGLRLGWLEVPAWLRQLWMESGFIRSGSSPNHYTSAIVGRALSLGLVKQHVEFVRALHKNSLAIMCKELDAGLPPGCSYRRPSGGYFVWIRLPEGISSARVHQYALERYGLRFHEGPKYEFSVTEEKREKYASHLRIAFSYNTDEKLVKGVRVLCSAIREVRGDHSGLASTHLH